MSSRRRFLRQAGLLLAAGCLPASRAYIGPARAAKQLSKDQVKYQRSPKDGKKCGECAFFISGGKCKLVQGEIDANGWCTRWTAK